MKHELIQRYLSEEEDTELVRHWFYAKGANWLNINEALGEDVIEVSFLDEKETLLSVFYSNWDSMELTAIVTTRGDVVCKGIFEIADHIEKHNLFIIWFRACYGDEDMSIYYSLQMMDEYYMVVDLDGRVKIEPTKDYIEYDDAEDTFVIDHDEDYTYKAEDIKASKGMSFSW